MSAAAREWLVVGIFFLGFFAFTLAEAAWVNRRTAAGFGRAFSFVFATNIFAVTIGFSVAFLIFGVIMAMAWDGSLQTVPGNDASIWAAIAVATLFPVILLLLAKRFAMRLFKLDGLPAWNYSIVSAIAFFIVVLSLPIALGALI